MHDAGIGRVLAASLHQAIAEELPTRLEFYESWLDPGRVRDGRLGLAPMTAVFSFLRQEGAAHDVVARRAGEYAAEWTAAGLSSIHRSIVLASPPALRVRLVTRIARAMVRGTYGKSRLTVRWRKGMGEVELGGSLFCDVREPVGRPLCAFYAAAIARLLGLFALDASVEPVRCRAAGDAVCALTARVRGATE